MACNNCGHDKKTGPVSDSSMDFILNLDTAKLGIKSREVEAGTKSSLLNGGTTDSLIHGSTTLLNAATNSNLFNAGAGLSTLQIGTQSTLLRTGSYSTLLQVGTKSTTLSVGAAQTLIQGNVQRQTLPVNVLILIDSSMTMKQGMDGSYTSKLDEKMAVAKRVLQDTLGVIPEHVKVGLRVFGGSTSADTDVACKQTALLVPIATNNRHTLLNAAFGLTPAGMTPLAYALSRVPDDFQDLSGVRRVVLISDGMDTCGGDPCALIKKLSSLGYRMKIDIVGLGLKHDKISRDELNCLAENSGGKYFDADTAAELAKALNKASMTRLVKGQ